MSLQSLSLNLPSMSQVVKERRREEELVRQRQRAARRTYQAAEISRLTSDWSTMQTTANSELRRSLRNLRARSRELARNNDYVKKFLGMIVSNIIGPKGITLQVRAEMSTGEPDQALNKLVEKKWAEWSRKKNASASGKLSWLDIQRLFERSLARDGEVLLRKVAASNSFGFALKFIDPAWLDETFNTLLPNGNRVMMSVEVDRKDRPVAYYLTPPASDYLYAEYGQPTQRQRVPAAEIIHEFLVLDDEAQTRGVPWAHTAMQRLQILGGYEEAELVAARVGACKGGFLIPPEGDEEGGALDDPDENPKASIVESMEPGSLSILPEGYTYQEHNPQHPNTGYQAFHGTCLRGISAGLEVAYFTLGQDWGAINFSSGRLGLAEERDIYRALQSWTIEHLCQEVFNAWAENAMLAGELPITIDQLERIKNPRWRPRGWASIDPVKEVAAAVLAIKNGIGTRTGYLGEGGEDMEETVATLAAEQQVLKDAGIVLDTTGLSELVALLSKDDPPPTP